MHPSLSYLYDSFTCKLPFTSEKLLVEKPPDLICKFSGYFDHFFIILTLLTAIRQTEIISGV
jgi:hypothetical protein